MNKFTIILTGELNGDKEFHCELTDEMNKHLRSGWKEHYIEGYHGGTYLLEYEKNVYAIRLPGATRGYVKTDDENIVTEVGFYEEQCYSKSIGCYERSL